jgi:hypothetical protein
VPYGVPVAKAVTGGSRQFSAEPAGGQARAVGDLVEARRRASCGRPGSCPAGALAGESENKEARGFRRYGRGRAANGLQVRLPRMSPERASLCRRPCLRFTIRHHVTNETDSQNAGALPPPESLNAIGDARIDCFEHFWQPSGREAAHFATRQWHLRARCNSAAAEPTPCLASTGSPRPRDLPGTPGTGADGGGRRFKSGRPGRIETGRDQHAGI